ncbi:hypothetical protein [Nannocystis pusilla]|uniref:hypothetical protein n=1 Tax=Nannocystis pusilla TaxID=889268 RepID=UPI003B8143E0
MPPVAVPPVVVVRSPVEAVVPVVVVVAVAVPLPPVVSVVPGSPLQASRAARATAN